MVTIRSSWNAGVVSCTCGTCVKCTDREFKRLKRIGALQEEIDRARLAYRDAQRRRYPEVREDRRAEQRTRRRANPASVLDSQRRDKMSHPVAYVARSIANNAKAAGVLTEGPCEFSGMECNGRIEMHHEDYSKPLEVRWLCTFHHRQVERSSE